MARRSRQESEETAARVRRTAGRLFAERGYAGVGLEEVAAAAAVTRGAVYHHYAGKRGLFEAVVADVQAAVAEAVERAASAADGPWAGLEAGCRAFLAAGVDPGTRRVMLLDAPAVLGWDTWRRQDSAGSGRLLDDVLAALDAGGALAAPSVPAASALLSGAMNEAALWIAAADDPAAASDEAWAVLEVMLDALRARPDSVASDHGIRPRA